jgi:hypothetical protein
MIRLKKIWITIILIGCSLLCLAACKQVHPVESISLNGYSAETPLELSMGKFSYGDYTVTITYDNGETEEVALTEDMISETDKLKFYQEGKSEITIAYKGVQTVVAIHVLRNQFSDNVQLNDVTATYTGKSFTVEVEGDLPGGTKILYPQGNTFQNAGVYDMTAILQCDGYVTKSLSARVVVEKAVYDVTNAQLYDETFVYDKDSHGLQIKGKRIEDEQGKILHAPASLPQGVSVRYVITKVKDGKGVDIEIAKQQAVEGNRAVDAGTYKVCAQFKGDASNYNVISDSVAYLTIQRAAYDMSKIEFLDATVTYSGKSQSLNIAEGSKIPLDVEVSYQIKRLKDGAGNVVIEEYKEGNSAIDAGVYLVKSRFNVLGKNAGNYTASPFEKEAYLTILCASYDDILKNVYLNSQWYEWEEGKTYEIIFDCKLPEGVSPQFTLTNDKGEVIEGRMEIVTSEAEGDEDLVETIYKYQFTVEETGEYTCMLTFVHNHKNYAKITLELKSLLFISSET